MVDVGKREEEERSEVTASSVFAACMTDADWSFNLRSATGFSDDDDDNEDDVGDTGTSSYLSSHGSQMLRQIDLAAREDNAQYKPNPWSIARVNAASRPRQRDTTVKPVSEKPVAKKRPQGAIVDAFKRQAQIPSSAQTTRQQTQLQTPGLTAAIDAPTYPVPDSARSPTSIAHIITSAVDPVPLPSQLRIAKETSPPSFLPRKVFTASHPSQPTNRSSDLHFAPSLKRVQPFYSPVPPLPYPQHRTPNISRPHATPPQAPAYFEPHISETRTTTPSKVHIVTNHVVPIAPVYREDVRLHRPTPERKASSPHPRQKTQLSPHPNFKFDQPPIKVSPKSQIIPPSPSFAQARRFFERSSLPVTTTKQVSPEPVIFEEEPDPSPAPSRPVIASPPRKYIDPYDQFPPSPDSEWSTLKPPTRKGTTASGKGKSKASDVKSGKFRLPLSMGAITPKEPPQKKARVVTYLPPPPPKKRKTVAESGSSTRDVEPGIGTYSTPLPL